MNVFISWSGDYSQQIANVIRDWLPAVLQFIKPFYTPNDIEKGARWSIEIAHELDKSSCGLFILTKDNCFSNWMLFEAGAISKKIDSSLICPILFGMKNSDVNGPFAQFQLSEFNKTDILKLLKTINTAAGISALQETVLLSVFEKWWPELEAKINSIHVDGKIKKERSQEDILNEILVLNRTIINSLRDTSPNKEYQDKLNRFFTMFNLVFDGDWEFTRSCFEKMNIFIPDGGTFIEPNVDDESMNWGNRGSLLDSYRDIIDYCKKNGIRMFERFDI